MFTSKVAKLNRIETKMEIHRSTMHTQTDFFIKPHHRKHAWGQKKPAVPRQGTRMRAKRRGRVGGEGRQVRGYRAAKGRSGWGPGMRGAQAELGQEQGPPRAGQRQARPDGCGRGRRAVARGTGPQGRGRGASGQGTHPSFRLAL